MIRVPTKCSLARDITLKWFHLPQHFISFSHSRRVVFESSLVLPPDFQTKILYVFIASPSTSWFNCLSKSHRSVQHHGVFQIAKRMFPSQSSWIHDELFSQSRTSLPSTDPRIHHRIHNSPSPAQHYRPNSSSHHPYFALQLTIFFPFTPPSSRVLSPLSFLTKFDIRFSSLSRSQVSRSFHLS
jgi:hypothetical protein